MAESPPRKANALPAAPATGAPVEPLARVPSNSPRTAAPPAAALHPPPSPVGLGARAWLLALAAQVLVLAWVVRSEITARVFISSWTISLPGILLLLLLLLGNAARRGRGLSRGELLAAYLATSSTIVVAGYNFLQLLVVALATGSYLPSPVNQWERVLQHAPAWLYPQDREAVRGVLTGAAAPQWEAWAVPLLAWSSLVLAVALAGLALAALLSDRWVRQERLAFPIAALPLEITGGAPGTPELFRRPLLWVGFALPCVLNSLLALHYYSPDVPALVLKHRDILEGAAPPLSVLRPFYLGASPFAVGLAFLAPLDISFSIWFFQWLAKGQRFLAFQAGYIPGTDVGGKEPYLNEQTVGAFLALGLLLLWQALPRRRAPTGETERGTEAVPAEPPLAANRPLLRAVVALLVLSGGYAFGFLVRAGFSAWVAAELLVLYFLTVLVIARVRAEAGFAWAYGPDRFSASLSHVLVGFHGTAALGPRNIALLGVFHWLWWDLRFALLPAQMEALRIGDGAGIRRRQLLVLLGLGTATAIGVGLVWILMESYRLGWGTAKTYAGPSSGARASLDLALNWMRNPVQPQPDRLAATAAGGGLAMLLGILRQRFTWWPFHPIGYAMAGTATSSVFWGHYFMAWVAKALLLRYGGMRLYRTVLPLVYGLILGDVASQTLWSLGTSVLDVPVYQFIS